MKHRSPIRTLLGLLLALCMLAQPALAATWYLDDGDLRIVANEDGQYVYQGSDTDGVADEAPVITQYDLENSTENTITLESEDGAKASVTIRDLNVETSSDKTLIDVVGDSAAEIIVKGENSLYAYTYDSSEAIVHVGDGSLTIQGDGRLEIREESHGAKLGSDEDEDFTGTIHITGNATVYTEDDGSCDGAAIGSGQDGDFLGTVRIDGNAHVTAKANDRGAGIGAGEDGDYNGTVEIGGTAYVRADGDDDSAGIGSGEDGSFSGGTIIIGDSAEVVATGSDEGPGIGAADDEPMNGTIIIRDNASVQVDGGSDAGDIGSEGTESSTGSIRIEGNASVSHRYDEDLVIGGEDVGYDSGVTIAISETATLNGVSGRNVLAGEGNVTLATDLAVEVIAEEVVVPEETFEYFRVLDENGEQLPYETAREERTLVVTVDAANASLHTVMNHLRILKGSGVDEIRFVTAGVSSTLNLSGLLAAKKDGNRVVVAHTGNVAALTVDGAEVEAEVLVAAAAQGAEA